jgi:hypothetical protein
MLCKGVGVGLTVNPEDGQVGVMLSLHDEETDDDARGFIVLPVERALEIATSIMARAAEGHQLWNEIMATPMDDRPAAVARIVERMHGPAN